MKNINKRKNGISLIVLVITILVMIILSGVVIVSLSKNNPIEKAKEATFKQDMASIGEELESFIVNKVAEDSTFLKSSLHADINSCKYNTNAMDKTIYDVLPSLKNSRYKKQIQIEQGSLVYKTPNKKEVEWLKKLGIHYTGIITGTVIIEGDTLVGVSSDYVNTGVLIIPSNVKIIKAGAFAGCKDITSVIIPESVTEIPNDCFNGCNSLVTVQMGSKIKRIGDRAFKDCYAIQEMNMPDEIATLGYEAFRNCSSLVNLKLSQGLKEIGPLCFLNCENITKIDFPNNITRIREQAFQRTGVTSIVLPESLIYIDYAAFLDCPNLTSIDFGNTSYIGTSIIRECPNVTSIKISPNNPRYSVENNMLFTKDKKELLFSTCGIVNAVIPNGVEVIGWEAFTGCTKMTSVSIPNTVLIIEGRAFERCISLESLHIPSSVIEIQLRVIEACSSLKSLTVDANNNTYCSENNILFDKNKTIIYACVNDKKEYIMPDTVTKIDEFAFTVCTLLEKIQLSNNLEEIATSGFYSCTNLKEINLPTSCKVIGDYAFRNCTLLNKLDLANVEMIGSNFLMNTYKLTNLVVPASVKSFKSGAFASNFLTNLTVDKANNAYMSQDNIIYTKDGSSAVACAGNVPELVIKSGTNSIHNQAFESSFGLKKVIILSGTKVIGYKAFHECNNLEKVTIPESVSVIDENAFLVTPKLSEIYIKKNKGSIDGAPWGATQGIKSVIWM